MKNQAYASPFEAIYRPYNQLLKKVYISLVQQCNWFMNYRAIRPKKYNFRSLFLM